MSEQGIYRLKINKDYKRLIPPLSTEELKQLEENIIRDGCRESLCVWRNTILDGHNRYEICTRLGIPFSVEHILIENNEEAVAWICANQLGRRNITDVTRRYLIGKRYEMEKINGARNLKGINQHSKKEVWSEMSTKPNFEDSCSRTRERLGKEYHISDNTVYKYGVYSQAMDSLFQATPELASKILSGEMKVSQEKIIELSKLSDNTLKKISRVLSKGEDDVDEYIQNHVSKKQQEKKQSSSVPLGSIKDMPLYDPDAEISTLVLTIPSWISSISRTQSVTDLSNATDDACHKLQKELLGLKEIIELMLAAIREVI